MESLTWWRISTTKKKKIWGYILSLKPKTQWGCPVSQLLFTVALKTFKGNQRRWYKKSIRSGKERNKMKSLSRVQLFATPWTIAYQAPLSMGFSRQEYWSGLPFPWWALSLCRDQMVMWTSLEVLWIVNSIRIDGLQELIVLSIHWPQRKTPSKTASTTVGSLLTDLTEADHEL